MPGYVIANYKINDTGAFEKYPPAVGPTLAQYGGRLLVNDRQVRAVEGSPQSVIVIVEFESVEAAQRWYDSPENKAVMGLRTSTTEGWLAIADGFVMPEG
ncbi:MAG: DUF1330 domain-containing protein [Deltaproteobacteria bacterium]|nr:DUF1330 domain-containing protein [Deltaproteobacteria bacterium]